MVPNGWTSIRLNKIAETVTSGSRDWAQYYSDSGSKFIRMTNLPRDGIYLKLDDLKYVNVHSNSSDGKRTSLKEGDLLISITAELGKIGWVPPELGEAYINQHTALVRINKENADSKYIAYLLSSHAMNHKINRLNDSGAKAGLNLPTIRSIPMVLPPLPEQRKIAKILSTWDKAISTTEKLIETSKQQKTALMQQLLTGKKRLVNPETGKVFEGEWVYVKAGDIFSTRSNKKHNSDLPILAITQDQGAIPRDLIDYNVSVTKESVASYKVVEQGDFIISLRSFQGGIEYSRYKGICSPAYVILYPKVNIIDDFYIYHLKSHPFIQAMKSKLEGIRDGKIISYKYFSEIKLPVPTIEEQKKISAVLTTTDKDITMLKAKLAHLKQEKKALMQQLLTGKRRVVVDEAI